MVDLLAWLYSRKTTAITTGNIYLNAIWILKDLRSKYSIFSLILLSRHLVEFVLLIQHVGRYWMKSEFWLWLLDEVSFVLNKTVEFWLVLKFVPYFIVNSFHRFVNTLEIYFEITRLGMIKFMIMCHQIEEFLFWKREGAACC